MVSPVPYLLHSKYHKLKSSLVATSTVELQLDANLIGHVSVSPLMRTPFSFDSLLFFSHCACAIDFHIMKSFSHLLQRTRMFYTYTLILTIKEPIAGENSNLLSVKWRILPFLTILLGKRSQILFAIYAFSN